MLVRFDSDPAEDDMLGARRLPSFIAVLRFRNPNLKFLTFAFTLHQICKHVALKRNSSVILSIRDYSGGSMYESMIFMLILDAQLNK